MTPWFCRLAEWPSEEGAHLLCRLQRRLRELQEWLLVLGIQWGFLGVSSCGRGCAERVSVRLNKPLNLSNVFLVLPDDPWALQMDRDDQMHISGLRWIGHDFILVARLTNAMRSFLNITCVHCRVSLYFQYRAGFQNQKGAIKLLKLTSG